MRAFYLLLLLPFFVFSQQENFKLTFNHQALPVKKLQETGDFYVQILGFEEMEVTADQTIPKRWLHNHEGKQLHLITSEDGVPNTIINHMAFSTLNLDEVVAHLRKNKVDYWTDEGSLDHCIHINISFKMIRFMEVAFLISLCTPKM